MIQYPISPIEALVAFTLAVTMGGLAVVATNHYGKWMYRKGQSAGMHG